jgi:hypothetical protein
MYERKNVRPDRRMCSILPESCSICRDVRAYVFYLARVLPESCSILLESCHWATTTRSLASSVSYCQYLSFMSDGTRTGPRRGHLK